MAIEIIEEFVDVKCGEKVCKVIIPTMQESDEYAENYDAAKGAKEKRKVLKDYLESLGLDADVYAKMRDSHLRQLIEAFSEKKP